jgi:serine/threonine protein kinase
MTTLFAKAGKDGLDLLRKMLCFSPKKRITIEEALNHPYLKSFHSPAEENICHTKAKGQLNDNIRLSKHDYKSEL